MKLTNCQYCQAALQGRADKKFCDDQCRTAYNNQFRGEPPIIREINKTLRKNRKILEQLIPAEFGKARVSHRKLIEAGYDFSYHTHALVTKAGAHYYFCYDYGYLKIEDEVFMLVRRSATYLH